MNVVLTLIIATLFAAIYLFGGRLAARPGHRGYRRFLSFAAGIAVGYTFVHVLPALGRMTVIATQSQDNFRRLLPEYSIYLWTMVGFLAFYCLESLAVRPAHAPEIQADGHVQEAPWQRWLHIGGFAVYAWLLTYLTVWQEYSTMALCLYAVAMSMHVFPIASNLSNHYQATYDRRGSFLLALASLAGWATGLVFVIPTPVLLNLVAVVAGGVIVNTAISELPREKEGRPGYFLAGAIFYTALLLILSHFEKGGAR